MRALLGILVFLKPYRRQLLLALAVVGGFTCLTLLSPWLLRMLFDDVIVPGKWESAGMVVLAIAGVPVLIELMRSANAFVIMRMGNRAITDMRMAMYRKVLDLEMQYHTANASGAVVARLMDDVNRLQRLMTEDTVRLIVDIVVFICSLGFVCWVSPLLAGMMAVLIVVYVGVYLLFSRRIRRATESYRELYDLIAGRLLMQGWPSGGWGWTLSLAALALAGAYNYLVTEYLAEQTGG